MKLLQRQSLGFLLVIFALCLVVAGCAPNANAHLVSPQLGEQLYAEEADSEIVIEPTPVPLRIADMTPEEIMAGLPEDFAAALASADASRGETVALTNGCVGCHSTDPSVTMTGPTWFHAGDHAANRQAGVSPALYLHDSIVNPNAYVVPSYPSGVMPTTYGDMIPIEDLANLVAFLLAQHE